MGGSWSAPPPLMGGHSGLQESLVNDRRSSDIAQTQTGPRAGDGCQAGPATMAL
jgi:hypothetical protein